MGKNRIIILVAAIFVLGILTGGVLTNYLMTAKETANKSERINVVGEEDNQLWTCGMHPEVIREEPGYCPKCGMELVPVKGTGKISPAEETKKEDRKILYWQAPMDPTEVYDEPGKSKMGMDLVPVYEDDVESGGMITIDPATVQNMGVKTTLVEQQKFTRSIRTVGVIEYNEKKLYTVNAKISGWIEKLYIDYTGQEVKKGEALLEIYSPELVTTQEEYLLALNNQKMVGNSQFKSIRGGAQSLLKSTKNRLLNWDIPESEIKYLEKTGEVRKTIKLNAPANGVVIHKNAVEGMHVKEGVDLYKIADLSTVWVDVSIYDNELSWIQVGQKAEMELSYNPGKTYVGRIDYIYPYLEDKTRSVNVRLEFLNPNLALKPEMYANISIKASADSNALVIPSEAVIRSGSRNIVFVARSNGRFEPREIKTGTVGDNDLVSVVSGLFEGEHVVTSAQFMLDSESRLQEAIQKMLKEKRETKIEKTDHQIEHDNKKEITDNNKIDHNH